MTPEQGKEQLRTRYIEKVQEALARTKAWGLESTGANLMATYMNPAFTNFGVVGRR